MTQVDIIRKRTKEILKYKSKEANQSLAHDWGHCQRVWYIARSIAKNYKGIDLEVLEVSSMLHDIDQPYNMKKEHAKRSLNLADKILKEFNYEKRDKVLSVIEQHSTEKIIKKGSMEAKILFDADKLDGLGPIGIARVFLYCGQKGINIEQTIRWYNRKINIALKNLQTKEGKQMANERLKFTKNFIQNLKKSMRNE